MIATASLKGAAGYSPTVTASQMSSGVSLTVQNPNTPYGTFIKNGVDGKTPVKGTDYFTAEDKAEMVSQVLAALPSASGVSF